MTNRVQYEFTCKTCGNLFTAYTSKTKYCGLKCARRGYKAEKRNEHIQSVNDEIKESNRQKLLSQENLSLTAAADLLSISRPTLYKLLTEKNIKLLRITKRTIRVKKSDLMELYQNQLSTINTPIAEIRKAKDEYIAVSDALEQFKISLSWFYTKIRPTGIKPTIIDGKPLYPIEPLKKLFAKKQYKDITEWLTVAEIIEKFGVSRDYIYSYISNHNIPRKKQGKCILISKHHWEQNKRKTQ